MAVKKRKVEEILTLIENRPDKWEQGSWVTSHELTAKERKELEEGRVDICGTQACVAGWAMLFSKEWRPELSNDKKFIQGMVHAETGQSVEEFAVANPRRFHNDWDGQPSAEEVYIKEGARLLGLTLGQAHHVFLDMHYESDRPKTFTDSVRHYLGMKTKWGTKFDAEGYVEQFALGEDSETLYGRAYA